MGDDEKQRAYDDCRIKYINTPESHSFKICSHNTFSFSVSWAGQYEGNEAIFMETSNNSYIILLNK